MSFVVISATDNRWNSCLKLLPQADIYFSAEYHLSFESSMNRKAMAFIFQQENSLFFFPFMISDIEVEFSLVKGYSDIETVYGYSGPITNDQDQKFIDKAWTSFLQWAEQSNVLCALIRFNPLLNNQAQYIGSEAIKDRLTVRVNLQSDFRAGYHPKFRNDVSKAAKLELEFVELSSIEIFKDLYIADMLHLKANSFYLFENEHFEFLEKSHLVKIYAVKHSGKVIAAATFMLGNEVVHYHLSASVAASELKGYAIKHLLHNAIETFACMGFKYLHLGGGRTSAEDDSLFFFKQRFGGDLLQFYLAKPIFLPEDYNAIVQQWQGLYNKQCPKHYLQFYRLK